MMGPFMYQGKHSRLKVLKITHIDHGYDSSRILALVTHNYFGYSWLSLTWDWDTNLLPLFSWAPPPLQNKAADWCAPTDGLGFEGKDQWGGSWSDRHFLRRAWLSWEVWLVDTRRWSLSSLLLSVLQHYEIYARYFKLVTDELFTKPEGW